MRYQYSIIRHKCYTSYTTDCERTDAQNGNTYDSIQRVEEE